MALTGETRTLEGSDPGRARGQLTVRPSVPRAHGSARSRGARSPVSAHHRTKTGQDHMAPHGRLRPNNPPRVLPDRTYGACILEGSSKAARRYRASNPRWIRHSTRWLPCCLPMEPVSSLTSEISSPWGLGHTKNTKNIATRLNVSRVQSSQSRSVQIRYFAASRNVTTRRSVDPYRLWYAQGALYLIGFCHLRRDVRMFAVDRIRSITTTNKPCQMPLGFDVQEYVADALLIMRGAPIDVQLSFHRTVAPWVCDRNWHSSQKVKSVKGGAVYYDAASRRDCRAGRMDSELRKQCPSPLPAFTTRSCP